MQNYRAEFLPQAWINSLAVECDAEGPRVWDIGPLSYHERETLDVDSETRDALRFHLNAPQWVKDWNGPFEIYLFAEGE